MRSHAVPAGCALHPIPFLQAGGSLEVISKLGIEGEGPVAWPHAWRALTDAQWERIRPHLPRERRHPRGGRPRADPRRCFEGILWILWTDAPWSELPPRYGSPTTCWRRLRQWEETGVLPALWRAFLNELNDRQKIR